jgi:hypothetical protein
VLPASHTWSYSRSICTLNSNRRRRRGAFFWSERNIAQINKIGDKVRKLLALANNNATQPSWPSILIRITHSTGNSSSTTRLHRARMDCGLAQVAHTGIGMPVIAAAPELECGRKKLAQASRHR